MDGETYLLKIDNRADADIDFWLFQDDVLRPELGEPTPPPPEVVVAPGGDPFHTLPLEVGVNTGNLGAGEERWYSFVRDDFDNVAYEAMALTMMFTPDDGNRVHQVRFELYPADQLHIWARGETDQMRNVGGGSVVSRDGNPKTGELLWSGWIMDGETYYLKVRNDADVAIDYWLFPGDIVRAELGEVAPPSAPVDVAAGTDPNHPLPLASHVFRILEVQHHCRRVLENLIGHAHDPPALVFVADLPFGPVGLRLAVRVQVGPGTGNLRFIVRSLLDRSDLEAGRIAGRRR